MRRCFFCFATLAALTTAALAAPAPLGKEVQDDIAKHRAISIAHEAAAKCLEAGKPDEVCEKELQIACKGLAIGKFCGMKH